MSKAPQLSELDITKASLLKKRKLLADKRRHCFVATNLNSKAGGNVLAAQKDTLNRGQWIVSANGAGKTAYGARELAWWFTDSHPYKQRLPEWGDQPLFMIISSKTTTIIEEEIWKNKLRPLIEGEYEEVKRDKECIRLIINPKNGNRIMFAVHNDAIHARERIQAFTAHVAWVDEMPDDSSYLSEILLRLRAGDKLDKDAPLAGYFYGTFTPLVEDEGVRQLVDSCTFPFVKLNFRMEDNPFYEGWSSEALDAYIRQRCQDDIEFRARRFGEWYYSSERVFGGYLPARNRIPLQFQYSAQLQHAIIVDPAASGKVGVSLAVLDPSPVYSLLKGVSVPSDRWWIVESRKLEGAAASLLVKQIEQEFIVGPNVYVTKDGRICDCAPSGFYKEAALQQLPYRPYRKKNDKKKESIEEVNKAFYNGMLMVVDSPKTEELHKELLSAKWKENESEIRNSHKFHCADTARYLWEMRPKREASAAPTSTWGAALRQAWKDEEAAKAAAAEKAEKKRQRLMPSKAWASSKAWARR
jgi:hypothetical protein